LEGLFFGNETKRTEKKSETEQNGKNYNVSQTLVSKDKFFCSEMLFELSSTDFSVIFVMAYNLLP
jgi:hypothetical protein